MKTIVATLVFICATYSLRAQIGVGTTSPNSTLDVRGSLSNAISTFTANTTAGASDNMLVFTGTSATTLTLPTAAGITGREYWIKNASSNSSVLTIATNSSQTIDGLSSWTLTQQNKAIRLVSNGTNWYAATESLPGSTGTPWVLGGNNVSSQQNIGTTSNYHLPFITNNTEKMRLTSTGNLGIGTSTFNATYPERLLVDAGSTGNTNYQNVIVGKGNTNSYAQLNIQNYSTGTGASSDVVATSDNGNETVNFVDMGINGSGNSSGGVIGGANTAYLYSTGNDFAIGNGSNSKNLNFFTTSGSYTERMRITGSGDVGIGTSSPNYLLHLHKSAASSNWMQITNGSTGTGTYDGLFYGVSASGQPQIWGAGDLAIVTGSGTTNNYTMTLTEDGCVGVNTSTFNNTYPEHLLVNAGSTGNTNYQNVIVGKGNTNSYAQLNITNNSGGSGASSDVVATANNGSETVNFIDMGINGGGNSSSGVIGGANTAYLYSTGNDFAIGNGSNSKDLVFFTTASSTYTERMRITNAGHLIPSANNSYNLGSATNRWATIYSQNVLNTSDARLKTNIRDLNYGLTSILNLHPVQYNWKEGIDKDNKIGFLAQELRTVIPEVVVGDESKENLAVNYIELIPVLVNAIKEQQKQIEALTKKVNLLERK